MGAAMVGLSKNPYYFHANPNESCSTTIDIKRLVAVEMCLIWEWLATAFSLVTDTGNIRLKVSTPDRQGCG